MTNMGMPAKFVLNGPMGAPGKRSVMSNGHVPIKKPGRIDRDRREQALGRNTAASSAMEMDESATCGRSH